MREELYTISLPDFKCGVCQVPKRRLVEYEKVFRDFGIAYHVSSLLFEVDSDGNVKFNV